jgi:lipid-A-disaccharide synthase
VTAASPTRPYSIYLVAAEESGDALGASLAGALRARQGGELSLSGIGGRAMAAAGIHSPFPIDELSIFGLTAIPRRLPLILRRIRETADAIVAARPDVVVIIDSPDFTHRVARRVRRQAPWIPILDYVSPSVWAWRPGRARAMRSYIDCVLAILPFEPEAYVKLDGPPCVYVGHPLIEHVADLRPRASEAERRLADPPLVLVLPGSRKSEIERLLPVFGAAISKVAKRSGPLDLVLPTMGNRLDQISAGVASWDLKPRIVIDPADKWAAFRSARAALAASGTVTLELAIAGVPTAAAYLVSPLEEMVARLMGLHRRLTTVILANLVLGQNVVPEFLQGDCTAEKLADALTPLLQLDSPERARQVAAFGSIDGLMKVNSRPSEAAATLVLGTATGPRHDVAAPQGQR